MRLRRSGRPFIGAVWSLLRRFTQLQLLLIVYPRVSTLSKSDARRAQEVGSAHFGYVAFLLLRGGGGVPPRLFVFGERRGARGAGGRSIIVLH